MKHLICISFLLSLLACRTSNPANQIAKELYPKYGHLSEPEHAFEQLWHLFDRFYAFFDEKKINWKASYEQYRPQVHANTSEKELVNVFAQMLNPLKDGHVRLIRADTNVIQLDRRPCRFAQTFRGRLGEFQQNTFSVLEQHGFSTPVGLLPTDDYHAQGFNHVYYYAQSDSWGYFRIVDCRDERNSFDEILNNLSNTKGLIIDLRYNLGGSVGKEMAGRFLSDKKVYGFKKQRGANGLFHSSDLVAKPEGELYTKPIVILINDATFSAAEEFALVLSKEAHVNLVGSHTGGYFSDVFNYRLPNGMNVWLSHEQYFSADSVLLEDRGVEPEIYLENTLSDLKEEKDPLINKAISLLQRNIGF